MLGDILYATVLGIIVLACCIWAAIEVRADWRQYYRIRDNNRRRGIYPPMKPNYHKPTGKWTGVSPSGNPNVVYHSDAPRLARLRLRLRRGKQTYVDPDSGRKWRA